MEKRTLYVGQSAGDFIGRSQVPIQGAIDYLSYIGGGTVFVGEGEYDIETSIQLRPGVHLEGVPGKTLFRKCAEAGSPLVSDADMHERQITAAHPERFRPGQSVTIRADNNLGFFITVATITAKRDHILYLDREIAQTALVSRNARVSTMFPVISVLDCADASIRHIHVDGNKERNSIADGCRNAGIYMMGAKRIEIEHCMVRDFAGDGISYQCCEDIIVRNTDSSNNMGKGFHPGSGTKRTTIAGCRASGNGGDGIFLCWRVTDSIVEDCDASGNGCCGLSIGHKDTHNLIRNNRFDENGFYGIFFRNEPDPMGANYNRVENNRLKDNGSEQMGYVGIRLRGGTREVEISDNVIEFERVPLHKTIGICLEEHTRDIRLERNAFANCAKTTHTSWLIEE